MKLPSPINWTKYPNVTQWLNQLRECVAANEIKPSPNYKVNKTTGGTKLSISAQAGSGDTVVAETVTCPFDITLTDDGMGNFDMTILPGTLNSMLPADILTPLTYTTGSTVFVKISCLTDGKAVTSCSYVVDGTPPAANVANASEGTSTLDVCVAVIIDGVVTKTLGWCGSVSVVLQQVFLEDKPSPSIGESPYIRWYQWFIQAEG